MPARLRTISSTNSGLPPARAATKSRTGARPSSAGRAQQVARRARARPASPSGPELDRRHARRARCAARARRGAAKTSSISGRSASWSTTSPQQVHRGRVGPMQVVDHDHQRLLRQPALDQRARRQRDLALQLLGFDVARPGFLDAEQVVQHLRDRIGLVGVGAEGQQALAAACAGPPPANRRRRRGRPRGTARRRCRRSARRATSRWRGARRSRPAGRRLSSRANSSASRRDLPAPASPTTLTTWAWPLLHAVERGQQALDAHRRARPAAPPGRGRRARARRPPRRARRAGDGPACGCALPRSASSAAGSKSKRCRTSACVASDTSTVPGAAADEQARGGVHGVAGDRVGAAGAAAQAAGHHRAGVDADVQRHRRGRGAPPTAALSRVDALHHLLRRFERAQRIVLVRARRAEHRHHRVADELLDEAVVARDRPAPWSRTARSGRRARVSGSSRSASEVKPVRSANTTVTWRRSAS